MICITVTPESRKLAKVDLLNASRFADLIELCLDRMLKAPDVGELKEGLDKPLIVSCRREIDGGQFAGTEEERIALLRQAIISGPDYVELDLEAAKQIPRFGETKRVISITSLNRPIDEVNQMFDEAWQAKADVVKFTWKTDSLESAWPLLKAVVDKREVPVVGLGIGRCGITFSLLGHKYGSPWIYAALEKGMEAFPGQTTAFDLDEIYDLNRIAGKTRFLALVGYSTTQALIAKVLNQGFAKVEANFRCLPMQVESLDKMQKRLETLKIPGLIVNPALPLNLSELADNREEAVEQASAADLIFHKGEHWKGFNLLWRVMLKSIEQTLAAHDQKLKGRNVLVFGGNPLARSMIYGLNRRECIVSVTSPHDTAAMETAKTMQVRHVPYANVYGTLCELAVIADPGIQPGTGKTDLNPAFFRPDMTVADFSRLPEETPFTIEAKDRNCRVIDAKELGYEYLSALFKAISGTELDRTIYDQAFEA